MILIRAIKGGDWSNNPSTPTMFLILLFWFLRTCHVKCKNVFSVTFSLALAVILNIKGVLQIWTDPESVTEIGCLSGILGILRQSEICT